MALVASLIKEIAQLIRPCPAAVIRSSFVRAARDLCGQSRWYQTDVDLTLQANVRSYALVAPIASGFASSQLEAVDLAFNGHWANSNLLGQNNWTLLGKGGTQFNPNLAANFPQRVIYMPEGEVAFDPIPDQAYPARVCVAWQPVEDATDIPDALLVKWREVIEAGALAYLYGLAGEPFADPNKAGKYGRVFSAGINNAKANVAMAFQSGSRRANPRAFFPNSGWPFLGR